MDTGRSAAGWRTISRCRAIFVFIARAALYVIAILFPKNCAGEMGSLMTMAGAEYRIVRTSRARRFLVQHPVLSAWAAMSLFLVLCHLAGYSPANDIDDLLKQVEIRNFLNTGAWFDRTIPGILQPEPFVSHWVRLVDLPYAAVAVALAPFAGKGAAFAAARYVVPLLLLLPVLA